MNTSRCKSQRGYAAKGLLGGLKAGAYTHDFSRNRFGKYGFVFGLNAKAEVLQGLGLAIGYQRHPAMRVAMGVDF